MGHRFHSRRYAFRLAWSDLLSVRKCWYVLRSAYGCWIVDAMNMPEGLIEEMGLLYVGVTRARKAVYVSASLQRRTKCGNHQVACPSCLTSLPGIEPVSWAVMDGGVICGGMECVRYWREVWSRLPLWSHGVCPSCPLTRTAWPLAFWWDLSFV